MPPRISRLPITPAGAPAFARTGLGGGFGNLPSASPARNGKCVSQIPAESPGAQLVLGAMGEPLTPGGSGEGWRGWDRGNPRHPEPIPGQGRAEWELGFEGTDGASAPRSPLARGCGPAADVPPVPGALRGAGRMQALLCISN